MRRYWAVGLLALATRLMAAELLPWQSWVETADPAATRPLDLTALTWRRGGGSEGVLTSAPELGPWAGPGLVFNVTMDHHNAGAYPQGWPSFETQPQPNLDLTGYDALQYWIRGETAGERPLSLRFILWSGGSLKLNVPIPGLRRGEWVLVTHKLRGLADLERVERLHFYLSESDYRHGDQVVFQVGGFRLCNLTRSRSQLAADQGAAGLWVGERADRGEQAVILERGTRELPATLVVETGQEVALRPDDTLQWRLRNLFSGEALTRNARLGQAVAAGSVVRLEPRLSTAELSPGYWLAVADIQRGGKSLLGGRVGADDLYVKAAGESMTYTVLSIRAGMTQWVRDLLHGDLMVRTRIALPHVYDPLDPATYPDFLRLFAFTTGKHTEGLEAGDTGLAYAAAAFRAAGDSARCRFVEELLEDSFTQMMAHMQAPSGGVISWANYLADHGVVVGEGGPTQAFGSYDNNQMGEWMRALTYGILYFRGVPGKEDLVRRLNAACRRAGDFIVAHSLQDSDGVPGVLRHLGLEEKPDGQVAQRVYRQEGRQCDVYLGRALAGLGYYAYAMQLGGETVPESWWAVFDQTARWVAAKLKPNGWFDWQCEDIVEGGCHTFLGNIYIGEGLFGCYLANRRAGRHEAARQAADLALKSYRYVTDDCLIRGRKFEYPLEFWVGPYVYWLFTQYQMALGPEPKMTDWLTVLDRKWSVERGWHDFLDRAPTGGCGRTTTNGALETSILGYLGIKAMTEQGQPWRWE